MKQKISNDLKEAMRANKNFEVSVLRIILSVFHNKEIEKKSRNMESSLLESEAVEILIKEANKRKEALKIYQKAGRNDLAEKEAKELEIIKKYLPEQLSEEEIEKIINIAIEKISVKYIKSPEKSRPIRTYGMKFGMVMAEVMKELKGKADALIISEIIKKKIEKDE